MGVLDGKVALISGAGTGIGRGTAHLFASEGAKVLIAARREEKLQEVASHYPDNISYVLMDLRNRDDRHRALDTAKERYGRLDTLINNAANQYFGPFMQMTEDEMFDVINTNVVSNMQMIHRAVPLLKETKGSVINISSTAGRHAGMPPLLMVAYASSRGGMNQMTRTLATELGEFGIRVNAIAPGLTHGEAADAGLLLKPDAPLDALRALTPLGRFGEPIDIARVLLFMASDQAGWITGQVLDVSGGWQIGGG